jgi:hypothetical protein
MTDSEDSLDFVEQALTKLRDVPVPEGPSAHILGVTATRLRSLETSGNAHPRISERAVQSRFSWYGGLAAACAVGIAAIAWIGLIGHSATFAFAEAQAKVNQARSVSYVETRRVDKKPVENNDPRAIKVLSDSENPRRHFVLGRYLRRTEVLDANGQIQSVDIYNATTGKKVKLFPNEKRVVSFGSQVTMDIDGGKVTEAKIVPVPTADFYTAIREVPAEAMKRLPAKKLGDKQVMGFYWEQRIDKKKGQDTWKRTYWIDTKTKLPVRIEISHRSTDSRVGPSDWVQSDFVFGEELDESLFSTEPPEGYTAETQKIHGIRIP